MLFVNSATPRIDREECALPDSKNCLMMFCHSEWYRDLILANRGPENKSEIVMWPYPIDPMPEGPLPAEYDLLIYAKNGHRPGLLKYLAEQYPNHIQFHYGQYKRADLIEAARRSRACAYLADDDHGPLALQEILLAGCPTIGVRTAVGLVSGETGIIADELPSADKTRTHRTAVNGYFENLNRLMRMSRDTVAEIANSQFNASTITDALLASLWKASP